MGCWRKTGLIAKKNGYRLALAAGMTTGRERSSPGRSAGPPLWLRAFAPLEGLLDLVITPSPTRLRRATSPPARGGGDANRRGATPTLPLLAPMGGEVDRAKPETVRALFCHRDSFRRAGEHPTIFPDTLPSSSGLTPGSTNLGRSAAPSSRARDGQQILGSSPRMTACLVGRLRQPKPSCSACSRSGRPPPPGRRALTYRPVRQNRPRRSCAGCGA